MSLTFDEIPHRMVIFGDIHVERRAQDEQWGGPGHDDGHPVSHWLRFIEHQIGRARAEFFGGLQLQPAALLRARYIKIAALAVAASESIDRVAGGGIVSTCDYPERPKLTSTERRILAVFGGWLSTQFKSEDEAQGLADLMKRFEDELPDNWRELAEGVQG